MTRKIRKHRFNYRHLKVELEVWYSKTLSIREMDEIVGEIYPATADMEQTSKDDISALTIHPVENGPILVLFNKDSSLSDILHESVHVTTYIFDYLGQSHNIDTDEFYAYTLASIFEDIIDLIKTKFKGVIK